MRQAQNQRRTEGEDGMRGAGHVMLARNRAQWRGGVEVKQQAGGWGVNAMCRY